MGSAGCDAWPRGVVARVSGGVVAESKCSPPKAASSPRSASYTEARPYAGAPGGKSAGRSGARSASVEAASARKSCAERRLCSWATPVIPTGRQSSFRTYRSVAAALGGGSHSEAAIRTTRTLEVAPPAFGGSAASAGVTTSDVSSRPSTSPFASSMTRLASPSSCQYPSPSSPPSSVPSSPPESADAHRLTGRRSDTATPVGTLEAETLEETSSPRTAAASRALA